MKTTFLFASLLTAFPGSTNAASLSPEASFLEELVGISSGTADASGVNRVQARVEARLTALGFRIERRKGPEGKRASGELLIATRAGSEPGFITLIGHADTVFETANPFHIGEDGEIATGSGVADDKGGLVVGISAIERYLKTAAGKSRYSIRFVISPSEETGSAGFTDPFLKIAEDSRVVLGLEPARENGAVLKGRKGSRWVKVTVTGREAHAGVDHESGVNACLELAIKLKKLQDLTDYKAGTTVSIGHMEGGKDKFNIVCGEASAKVDSRFADADRGAKVFREMKSILARTDVRSAKTGTPTETRYEILDDTPPFHASAKAKAILEKYLSFLTKIEKTPAHAEVTGGAGDVNYMGAAGVPIIDGLGPIGGGYHTAGEFVRIGSLATRAEALAELIEDLNRQ